MLIQSNSNFLLVDLLKGKYHHFGVLSDWFVYERQFKCVWPHSFNLEIQKGHRYIVSQLQKKVHEWTEMKG